MYKITLFDDNMPSCTSGTVSYYCDDIDKFEKEWIRLEQDESRIERFRRSKAGEMVTDYYCDIPELNIVQKEDMPRTFYERDVYIEDETITLRNGYGSETDYYIHKAHIHLRGIRGFLDNICHFHVLPFSSAYSSVSSAKPSGRWKSGFGHAFASR